MPKRSISGPERHWAMDSFSLDVMIAFVSQDRFFFYYCTLFFFLSSPKIRRRNELRLTINIRPDIGQETKKAATTFQMNALNNIIAVQYYVMTRVHCGLVAAHFRSVAKRNSRHPQSRQEKQERDEFFFFFVSCGSCGIIQRNGHGGGGGGKHTSNHIRMCGYRPLLWVVWMPQNKRWPSRRFSSTIRLGFCTHHVTQKKKERRNRRIFQREKGAFLWICQWALNMRVCVCSIARSFFSHRNLYIVEGFTKS